MVSELRSANGVFTSYQAIMPFAQTAEQKISGILEMIDSKQNAAASTERATSKTTPSDSSNLSNIDFTLTDFGLDYLQDVETAADDCNVFSTYLESPYDQEYQWIPDQDPFSVVRSTEGEIKKSTVTDQFQPPRQDGEQLSEEFQEQRN